MKTISKSRIIRYDFRKDMHLFIKKIENLNISWYSMKYIRDEMVRL